MRAYDLKNKMKSFSAAQLSFDYAFQKKKFDHSFTS